MQDIEQRMAEAEQALSVVLPERVRVLYGESDGHYDEQGQWYVVWPLDRLVEENVRAWKAGMLARCLLAFGDNGAGNPFCVYLIGDADEVVLWSHIDGEVERGMGTMAGFRDFIGWPERNA